MRMINPPCGAAASIVVRQPVNEIQLATHLRRALGTARSTSGSVCGENNFR